MNKMKNKPQWKKKWTAILTLTVFLLGMMAQPVLALDFGVYTAPANTYYKNPETGEIEDGGTQNEELGEGMCRSAVDETALIEVDADGNVYVTMRMLLYSNLSKIKFYVQDKPGGSYSQVKASITAEDSSKDSADFRMKMPSANANVKTVMYVAPMGRDVTFFWNVSAGSAQSGSGDFAVNINLNAKPKAETSSTTEPQKAETQKTETPAQSEPVKEVVKESVKEAVPEESVKQEPVQNQKETQQAVASDATNKDEIDKDKTNEANEGNQSEPIKEEAPAAQGTIDEAQQDDAANAPDNTADSNEPESDAPDTTGAEDENEEEESSITGPILAILAVAVIAVLMVVMQKK